MRPNLRRLTCLVWPGVQDLPTPSRLKGSQKITKDQDRRFRKHQLGWLGFRVGAHTWVQYVLLRSCCFPLFPLFRERCTGLTHCSLVYPSVSGLTDDPLESDHTCALDDTRSRVLLIPLFGGVGDVLPFHSEEYRTNE